ncbi:hypothetical protein ACFL7M_18220 [Thermodesulfobacteriota bacterium]
MSEIWRRAFNTVTYGADFRQTLLKSMALAIPATIVTLPYFYHLISVIPKDGPLSRAAGSWSLILTQLFLLLIVCLLSAMVGFSFSRRFKLPGFGDRKEFIASMPLLMILGTFMVTLSYLLFDRYFYEISPSSYPEGLLYLISFPIKGAFTEEIILRLCMVTIGIGLLKNRIAGVVLVSILASFFTLKYFFFIGIGFGPNYLLIIQFLLSFSANLILGYLFVTKGLLYSMTLKLILGMKYTVVTCIF